MRRSDKTIRPGLLVFILTVGVFGIINTEMGVVGILPLIAETFGISVPQAGWTVGAFALVVAVSGPVMPLLFSGFDRRKVMVAALGMFVLGNLVSVFATNYAVLLAARIIPAFFHPVYVSMAFTVAASSVARQDAPRAVSKVFIGVSAGMVLGVPVTSLIASHTSFSMAMVFFTLVNAAALAATILLVPSMPVTHRATPAGQLRVLAKPVMWYSIAAVTLINAAMFGFFSYMSDFLKNVTALPVNAISAVLFIYGAANIIGNIAAGRLLARRAVRTIIIIPFLLAATYVLLFLLGSMAWPMAAIILVLGILAGIASNNSQFMISRAGHEAPDFANGLFLTSANLGTTIGTAVCGLFISAMTTRYSVMGALLLLALSIVMIIIRVRSGQTIPSTPNHS